jgi:hypothetical protein
MRKASGSNLTRRRYDRLAFLYDYIQYVEISKREGRGGLKGPGDYVFCERSVL